MRRIKTVFFVLVSIALILVGCHNKTGYEHEFYDNEEYCFRIGNFHANTDTFTVVFELQDLYRHLNIRILPEFAFYDRIIDKIEHDEMIEVSPELYDYAKQHEVHKVDSIYNVYLESGIKQLILNYDFEEKYESNRSEFYYVVYLCCLNNIDVYYNYYFWQTEDKISGEVIDRGISMTVPEFSHGLDSLTRYIDIQASKCQSNRDCKVICTIGIDSTGLMHDIYVNMSSGDSLLDKKAVDILSSLPRWIPATRNGKRIDFKYHIAVRFKENKSEMVLQP